MVRNAEVNDVDGRRRQIPGSTNYVRDSPSVIRNIMYLLHQTVAD